MWNPSYCAVTVSDQSRDQVMAYIEGQKKKGKKKVKGAFMQIVSSYGVEVKKQNIPIRHTLDIFRKAVSYLIGVYAESWEELSEIGNTQKRFNEAEHLVHETKKNRARFAFDRHFPKMPSYLRRAGHSARA